MLCEPGTIYSDDEFECYSEDGDDDDEKEIERSRISVKKADSFFEGLISDQVTCWDEVKLVKDDKPFGNVTKYLDNKKVYDLDSAIERVRTEQNIKKIKSIPVKDKVKDQNLDASDDEDQKDASDDENDEDRIKLRVKDVVKKEKKRIRKTEQNKSALLRDKEKLSFEDAPPVKSDATFLEMNLSSQLMKAITKMGYELPTPIQSATIPVALKGRDICGCAATGTGKTAAFMLPIIQRLIFRPTNEAMTRVLVLVPTRELGVQVFEVTRDLSEFTNLNTSLTVGGLNMNTQTEELLQNPDIIIATPGRLIDHIHNTPTFSLREIEILVLDEADRMLDEYFAEQLKEIVRQCCITRQTMLFSATMTDQVKDLVAVSLKNPVRVFVNNNTDVAQNLRQEFIRLSKGYTEEHRLAILAYLLNDKFKEQSLVFITRKSECHRMHVILGLLGIKCGELHGDLKQNERLSSLQKFRDKQINVLFATDVAARGLDIKGISTVINYAVPDSYQTYVHRVGRTARAGFTGRAVTIAFGSGDDYKMLRLIQKNSLTPLFERVIRASNVKMYLRRVQEVQPAIEKVLELEKAEKSMADAGKTIDKLKKKLKDDPKEKTVKKPPVKKWFQTEEEIKNEKERLKLIIQGQLVGKATKKSRDKKRGIDIEKGPSAGTQKSMSNKKLKVSKIDRNENTAPAAKKNIEYFGNQSKKLKSNFVNELTSTNPELIKRLKRGPTYEERKETFEKKNPGKKFTFSKSK